MSDLSAPLAPRRQRAAAAKQQRGGRRHLPVARLATAGIGLLVLILGARIVLVETPDGGRPAVEVAINATPANAVAGANAAPSPSIITVGPEIPADQVDEALAGAAVAAAPEPAPAGAAGAPVPTVPDAFGTLPDLVEETEFGPLPRRSASGATPFEAYRRPSVGPAAAAGRPLVAIVVTGLGISVNGTLDAIARLPDAVTLAFAPYGKTLERTVGAARAEGHEIFLEVPLEPFDYPDNDPGPDTLLTGQAPRDNMDRLYRVMGKFAGYAGLINNMGARFTASGADFGPMMEELGARGLAYLDDGSSNRSLAPPLAEANGVPFARVDLMIDASPVRAAILAQLTALEDTARQQGRAIGLATALPVSVEAIAEWARAAEERGILLVPVSALMQP